MDEVFNLLIAEKDKVKLRKIKFDALLKSKNEELRKY